MTKALRMSTMFLRTLREDPADADVVSDKLLQRACYLRKAAPGIWTWLPLGLNVLNKIENIIREEMASIDAQEVHFSGLLPREPYEATHRWEEYGDNIFRLKDRHEADYLLAPTHEEMFTLLVKDLYSSYKDLPVTLYQIQTKYRDEFRPRAGLIRGREFIMKDAYSFTLDKEGLVKAYMDERGAYERIFNRLDLKYVPVHAMAGPMGGFESEEFLAPMEIGEDTFAQSPSGKAWNVEALTTPEPEAIDFSNTPAAEKRPTPNAETIDQMVEFANANHPRSDGRAWEASDILKNVVIAVMHPQDDNHDEPWRELVVVGVPGDRSVDMKRLEASVAPAEVEMASDSDFEPHPELVRGYIGPTVLGPNSPKRVVDEEGNVSGSVRYLVDPRVVEGTAWVTGANAEQRHILNLVMGRDFTADGTIEAAEVREGDLAPDGSGPLHLERGIEIGHIFQLGRKYAKALGLTVLDENGKTQVVTMGSYGIGVTRVMAALAEANCDEKGLSWPAQIAPFDVHVLATGKGDEVFDIAQSLGEQLDAAGLDVLVDDRRKVSAGVKFKDYELVGVPFGLVVGRSLADGEVEIRVRATGETIVVPVDEAVTRLRELHAAALKGE